MVNYYKYAKKSLLKFVVNICCKFVISLKFKLVFGKLFVVNL